MANQKGPSLRHSTTAHTDYHNSSTLGTNSTNAGTPPQMRHSLTIQVPALLPGIRCFVDASTTPDTSSQSPRKVGIGILFVNTQVQLVQTIYIKAIIQGACSVVMAEAAALAMAAMTANLLYFSNVCFLSDSSQFVQFINSEFINSEDHNHPPDWCMKPYTQAFDNCASTRRAKVYKISRTLNTTADALARQAFSVPDTSSQSCETACSYSSHSSQCPLLQALQSITLHSVKLLAASRC